MGLTNREKFLVLLGSGIALHVVNRLVIDRLLPPPRVSLKGLGQDQDEPAAKSWRATALPTILGLAALGLMFFALVRRSAGSALRAIASAGKKRVGPATSLTDDAFVAVPPKQLAAQAGMDLEAYSLARLVASEAGSQPPVVQLAVAEAIRNRAVAKRTSITALLVADKTPSQSGFYGRQLGRVAATTRDPNEQNVAAAIHALRGSNVTKGATHFFDPQAQDRGTQAGTPLRPTEEIISRFQAEGLQWVGPVEGINPFKLALFKKVSKPNNFALLAEINRGRGRVA